MKYLQLTMLLLSAVLLAGCLDLEDETEIIEGTSSSSGSSSSGSVLNYGGYSYTYSCTNIAYYYEETTTTIPPTVSSHCAKIYERVASEVGCNIMDSYSYLMSEYQSCINKEVAACGSASLSDSNCY